MKQQLAKTQHHSKTRSLVEPTRTQAPHTRQDCTTTFHRYIAALHAETLEKSPEPPAELKRVFYRDHHTSPLLSLPPELRNEICHYTFETDDGIFVDKMSDEPGLLAPCRQTWDDASAIYCLKNYFHIFINKYNGDMTWLLGQKWWVYDKGRKEMMFYIELSTFQSRNGKNLMRWLKGCWRSDVLGCC